MVVRSAGLEEWLLWQGPDVIVRVNYRSIFSSERAPHFKKPAIVNTEEKSGYEFQTGARYEDGLADWPSVVTSTSSTSDVWESGCIDSSILDLCTRCKWVVGLTSCRFTLGKRVPGTHWIGGWENPRIGLKYSYMEKWIFLTLLGFEFRPLRCPACK
jgi:hypothetical protein